MNSNIKKEIEDFLAGCFMSERKAQTIMDMVNQYAKQQLELGQRLGWDDGYADATSRSI